MGRLSHRVMVINLGKVTEPADADEVYKHPRHPYARALMGSVPIPDPRLERTRVKALVKGDVRSLLVVTGGCPFGTRCGFVIERCGVEAPEFVEVGTARVALVGG